MEIILELFREDLKGIVRELAAYFILKDVLENKKTTPRRRKHRGGSDRAQTFTTTTQTVSVEGGKCSTTSLFLFYGYYT